MTSDDQLSSPLWVLLTEWKQYRELAPLLFGEVVAQDRIPDGRDAPSLLSQLGVPRVSRRCSWRWSADWWSRPPRRLSDRA